MWPWASLYAAQVAFSMSWSGRCSTSGAVAAGARAWSAAPSRRPRRAALARARALRSLPARAAARALRRVGARDRRVGRHRRRVRPRARRATACRACSRRAAPTGCASSPPSSRAPRRRRRASSASTSARRAGAERLLRAVGDLDDRDPREQRRRRRRGPLRQARPRARCAQMVAAQLRGAGRADARAAAAPARARPRRGDHRRLGGGPQPLPAPRASTPRPRSSTTCSARRCGRELRGTGVDVLALQPGPTETEFQTVAGETAHAGEPPEQVVAWRSTPSASSPR